MVQLKLFTSKSVEICVSKALPVLVALDWIRDRVDTLEPEDPDGAFQRWAFLTEVRTVVVVETFAKKGTIELATVARTL